MTVPLLTANHKKIEYAAKLKKFYNTMTSAIEMAEMDYDASVSKWTHISDIQFFEDYLEDYIKFTKKLDYGNNDFNNDVVGLRQYYLDDGTIIGIDYNDVSIFYDVNGEKEPNETGRDQFEFVLNRNTGTFGGVNAYINKSRTDRITDCTENAYDCSGLIQTDGWEFKKDYPYKL